MDSSDGRSQQYIVKGYIYALVKKVFSPTQRIKIASRLKVDIGVDLARYRTTVRVGYEFSDRTLGDLLIGFTIDGSTTVEAESIVYGLEDSEIMDFLTKILLVEDF